MKQLTIFDAMVQFDESAASFKELSEFKYCYVKALIPKDIYEPIESKFRCGSKEFEANQERWSGYVWAIHSYGHFKRDWETACKLFKKHRDSQVPIELEVCLNFDFRPDHVMEYLTKKVE